MIDPQPPMEVERLHAMATILVDSSRMSIDRTEK